MKTDFQVGLVCEKVNSWSNDRHNQSEHVFNQ